ncbi:hypothetical protein GCM10007205_05870 [Oxalicibacterium flavum]|uniref:Uncharacterized protein n=1 Tax=Oxalicibacterium flavum TaxID=179467 RepID=A0A8J2UJI3_9BURK|nr:hypothetical protein GCM10007205_05870 [Oxalicibacterium flavum]
MDGRAGEQTQRNRMFDTEGAMLEMAKGTVVGKRVMIVVGDDRLAAIRCADFERDLMEALRLVCRDGM